jgi:hypothetical protein
MRLKNLDLTSIQNKTTFTLERAEDSGLPSITFTLHALSPDYPDEAENEIPSPKAPRLGVSRDKKGRIDKDAQGRPVMLYDEQDEEYQKKLRNVNSLQAMKMIVDALDPDEVQFAVSRDGMTPAEYYAAVRREMTAFGISLGDYSALIKAVAAVSNLDEKDIKAARADFFGKEESPDDS